MKKTLLALAVTGAAIGAMAKLPPPDAAAKAKADETKAKAAWQAKADAFRLCKEQDKIAAKYGRHGAKEAPKAAAAPAKPAASGASAAASSTTPAVASAPPPCVDPGPFAYNAPEQKPLETSGAHSPSGTAANAPSVRHESEKMQPSGKK